MLKGFSGVCTSQEGDEDDRAVQPDKATEIVCLRSDLWERQLRHTLHLSFNFQLCLLNPFGEIVEGATTPILALMYGHHIHILVVS